MAAKTVSEMSEAQSKLAQQGFEDAMAAATKISEMTIKLCTEALEPINDQVTKTVKKASEGFSA
jgi:phasin family protein